MSTSPNSNINLASDNHLVLARGLSDLLIQTIREKQELGNDVVATKLTQLRDTVWPERGGARPFRQDTFAEVVQGLNSTQRTQLLEAYAHMGHLHEIAGLMARENYFDKLRREKRPFPGGVREFILAQPDVETAVGKLAQPVFEVVMTMHPTNVNSLEFMQAQRELGKAMATHDTAKVKNAIEAFQRTPVLHQVNRQDTNLTVRDETNIVINFLSNIYEDFPRIYGQYDDALKEKSGNYDPLSLKLNMRFGSWGSAGDKDGNDNVTAEKTLEAIAMHTREILVRYEDDLKKISSPALDQWKEKITRAKEETMQLLTDIETLRDATDPAKGTMTADFNAREASDHFDGYSYILSQVRKPLDATEFEKSLQQAYQQSSGEERAAALDMIRKVRTFGFNFSKIEYREKASEYDRVVGEIIPDFNRMPLDEKVQKLTELLQNPGEPQKLYEAVKDKINASAQKPYTSADALPIAYHTMKRMELARDHGGMIRDNVLAECGQLPEAAQGENIKSQGLLNLLEAQFLQQAAAKDGKRPLLGIVPLFEEPDTMKNIDGIMEAAYTNPAYQQHMELLAHDRNGDHKVQQVQIAHSDNARRAGLQAARAFIHEAHKKMRELNKRHGIQTQFFEGGSISDAYRNGVRAISASVNAFQLHDFAKFTFQGGDLLNYFNLPVSNARIFARNIVHQAEKFHKGAGGDWEINHAKNAEDKRQPNSLIDGVAIAALKRTLEDYQKEDFTPNAMGIILAALDYDGEVAAGTRGSRKSKRSSGMAFAKVDSCHRGATLNAVPIESVRTIGFSEAWQHGGIIPSWIGSQKLAQYLQEETTKLLGPMGVAQTDKETKEFFEQFVSATDNKLTPRQIHTLYEKSPAFRDAQDRAAFALALTDPQALIALRTRLEAVQDTATRTAGLGYLERIGKTYKSASELAFASLRGEKLNTDSIGDTMIQKAMTHTLARLTDDIERKGSYGEFLRFVKSKGGLDPHDRGIIHNAYDTVTHGRYPTADDPAYGQARVNDQIELQKLALNSGMG